MARRDEESAIVSGVARMREMPRETGRAVGGPAANILRRTFGNDGARLAGGAQVAQNLGQGNGRITARHLRPAAH